MKVSAIWQSEWKEMPGAVNSVVDDAANRIDAGGPIDIFFRADDVAVPGAAFERMMDLFTTYRTPLALAVVPAWLTTDRWAYLVKWSGNDNLWCWHQHGWRHKNHERAGKRSEFGAERRRSDIIQDLEKGRYRLENLMGSAFCPVFTPPWNRCDRRTLYALRETGCRAVSLDVGSLQPVPAELNVIPVHVDLHTRKETDAEQGRRHLMAELRSALAGGTCGIMIHHQRMNDAAFRFLEQLLRVVSDHHRFRAGRFEDHF